SLKFSEEHDQRVRAAPIGAARYRGSGLPFFDVVRRVEGGVDPTSPSIFTVIRIRQLEVERLPIGIQDCVKQELLVSVFRGECQGMRRIAPVWLPEFYAVPRSNSSSEKLVEAEILGLRLRIKQQTSRIEERHEPMHIGVFLDQRPVKPTGLVIMAIGVVVATQ